MLDFQDIRNQQLFVLVGLPLVCVLHSGGLHWHWHRVLVTVGDVQC